MHPHWQFLGLLVAHIPSCLHVLLPASFVFPRGGGGGGARESSPGGGGVLRNLIAWGALEPPPHPLKMVRGGVLRLFYDASTPFVKKFSGDILLGLHIHSFWGPLELGIWTHTPQHLRPLGLGIWAPEKAWVM